MTEKVADIVIGGARFAQPARELPPQVVKVQIDVVKGDARDCGERVPGAVHTGVRPCAWSTVVIHASFGNATGSPTALPKT